MECILVALPFVLGLIALIQLLSGDEEGARQTDEAINAGISGLGRNLFLLELLDDRSAGDDSDHDWW